MIIMKECNFVTPNVSITYYRNRHYRFSKHFRKSEALCYCHDIHALFKEFKEEYNFNEWRLFIDSSKLGLKAVLLHQGNKKPSIPVAHAVNMKESYVSIYRCRFNKVQRT